jgi:hypothetical protein
MSAVFPHPPDKDIVGEWVEERNVRYCREIGKPFIQEGTDVITTTSDTTSTGRNGTDSSCRFA